MLKNKYTRIIKVLKKANLEDLESIAKKYKISFETVERIFINYT